MIHDIPLVAKNSQLATFNHYFKQVKIGIASFAFSLIKPGSDGQCHYVGLTHISLCCNVQTKKKWHKNDSDFGCFQIYVMLLCC